MGSLRTRLMAMLLLGFLAAPGQWRSQEKEVRLPNGKLQKEAILKADHERSLEDAAKLTQLSEELQDELEQNDRHVLSISTLKKLDEIEKIAKRLKSRLKRY